MAIMRLSTSSATFGKQLRTARRAAAPAAGRQSLQVLARGPIVTKKGVAFKKSPGVEEDPIEEEPQIGALGYGAIAAGVVANPLVLWSAVTLATTGSGLPEGPGGALGAAEGISYIVVLGLIAWSLYTKVATGKGLPPGPAGLLGAVEGISYLSLLGAIIAFAIKP